MIASTKVKFDTLSLTRVEAPADRETISHPVRAEVSHRETSASKNSKIGRSLGESNSVDAKVQEASGIEAN